MRFVFLVSLFAFMGAASPQWKRVASTSDGIVVHARIDKTRGQGETLAKGLIQAPVTKVWAILTHLDAYASFMPYMRTSRVLKRTSAHVWQYCRTKTPVASDRDYTLKYTLKEGALAKPWRIDWVVDNAMGPKRIKGVVRVSLATGSWELKSVQGGRATHATYRLETHPGGSIPLWLAHLGNKRAIPDILRAVRKRVR